MHLAMRGLLVFDDSSELEAHLSKISLTNKNVLMMSSGNFAGIDLEKIAG